jgi:phosphoserine phosphatase
MNFTQDPKLPLSDKLMTHVATLVGAAGAGTLTPEILAAAARRLPGAGQPILLAPGEAADIPFAPGAAHGNRAEVGFADAGYCKAAVSVLQVGLGDPPLDIFVQPLAGRRKKLLLADMDSTMIGQECIDELADFVGMKSKVAAITERAMRGEIDFEPALRERVALLAGLDAGVVDKAIEERITLTPGGTALVRTMRAHGAYTALVSGGFTLFTSRIGAKIGFDENRANELLVEDGRLVGAVREPILGKAAKLATLQDIAERLEISLEETLAIGDGANDLDMLEAAGLGVAYRAKPTVAAAAQARVEHSDLSALLYAQGFRAQEFVTE